MYLVENYYMKGDAFWLSSDDLAKYTERAQAIAPNVIGNVAPEVKLPNVFTQKEESATGLKARYTLLVFYSSHLWPLSARDTIDRLSLRSGAERQRCEDIYHCNRRWRKRQLPISW